MPTIAQKVDYVKQHGRIDSTHTCHWPGCDKLVPAAMWGCKPHWFKLPIVLRNMIWASYRPGQEVNKNPSDEYVQVANRVQQWIQEHGRQNNIRT